MANHFEEQTFSVGDTVSFMMDIVRVRKKRYNRFVLYVSLYKDNVPNGPIKVNADSYICDWDIVSLKYVELRLTRMVLTEKVNKVFGIPTFHYIY